ncbi:conserved hypothetical protein [Caldicellulosiruptor hydrothermalis 108]|uniref:CRISPR type III-associated protein domain-containing protein n=1 Tax=Caldicellulosiruptor hydrothermalis (strain DSM 18901 / VKM B-2411 / 108) TaxID=632292 RepID=E4QAG0_CALH1|nr:RAMP superfamily CRISPR-associated protein [Caldicellulosiruptor hydrothermalis]ADQ08264.1 conserved hypothetical protein [Caldicellulosiruptor hydrothermalis 108]
MKWYRLIFSQAQPIHIGSFIWGVVNETAAFIPGWTMWGALTNTYLRFNKFKDIEKSKEFFTKITNFYPAKACSKNEDKNQILSSLKCLFPKYEKGEFGFVEVPISEFDEDNNNFVSLDEFRFEFVDVIVSTAVEPVNRKAKDESLHEFEFILPKSKIDNCSLYWIGLIGFEDKEEYNEDLLKRYFSTLFVGGDIKYGYGKLELFDVQEIKKEEDLNSWNIKQDGRANIALESPLKQYVKFSGQECFEGEIKLIAEFDFSKNISEVSRASYYINIGSKIVSNMQSKNGDYNYLGNYFLYKGMLKP